MSALLGSEQRAVLAEGAHLHRGLGGDRAGSRSCQHAAGHHLARHSAAGIHGARALATQGSALKQEGGVQAGLQRPERSIQHSDNAQTAVHCVRALVLLPAHTGGGGFGGGKGGRGGAHVFAALPWALQMPLQQRMAELTVHGEPAGRQGCAAGQQDACRV